MTFLFPMAGLLIVSTQLSCGGSQLAVQELELRIDDVYLKKSGAIGLITLTPHWDEAQPPPPSFDPYKRTVLIDQSDFESIRSRLSAIDFSRLESLTEGDLMDLPEDARSGEQIFYRSNGKTVADWHSDDKRLPSNFREPFDTLGKELKRLHTLRRSEPANPAHILLSLGIATRDSAERCELVMDSSGADLICGPVSSNAAQSSAAQFTVHEFKDMYRNLISPTVFDLSSDRIVPPDTSEQAGMTFTFSLTVNHQSIREFTSPPGFSDQPKFEYLWGELHRLSGQKKSAQKKDKL